MKAMILNRITNLQKDKTPLVLAEVPMSEPKEKEVVIRVTVCGVCHTELDEIEGRMPPCHLPIILGHQVVGRVEINGPNSRRFKKGERVGVAWIFHADEACRYCREGLENLCPNFQATGRDANGGYAEYMTVNEGYAYPIPDALTDMEAAPLLCAGAIGYRSLKLTGIKNGETLGLAGFGASGHLVLKLAQALYPDSPVFVFARSLNEQKFALELGAAWAGDHCSMPPIKIHATIDTTPAWGPVVNALNHLEPGGRLVINAIRKEEIDKEALLKLDYPTHLWLEKEIKSVANVTRTDVSKFLELAARIPLKPEYQEYSLEAANKALIDLKERRIRGAKVLKIG